MRILLVTNGLGFGGAERVVEALANDLRRAGDHVRVVAVTRGGPIAEALQREGHRVDVLGLRAPWDAAAVWRLRSIAEEHRAEIVHSHLAVSDILSALACRTMAGRDGSGPRCIATLHNPGVELGRVKKTLWFRALGWMHRTLAVSRSVQRALFEHTSADVLHPSLVELDRATLPRDEARRRLALRGGVPLILGVGRLVPVKGFDVLADALSHLSTRGASAGVIGEGQEEAKLRASGLRLFGPHADAAGLLAAADVVVVPSRSEGFPQVPLEAMAAGRPVVATAVGGTPEIVVHEETGLLVPPKNPEALARALDRILAHPEDARRFGEAGRKRLRTHALTRPSMVDKTRSAYAASRR